MWYKNKEIMKARVTNKCKQKIINITKDLGYWSDEVRLFIEHFDLVARDKLHNIARNVR